MSRVKLGHLLSFGPVPQHHVQVVTTGRQKFTTVGEMDAVDAALVFLELPLQLETLYVRLEGVEVRLERGKGEVGIGTELATGEMMDTAGSR